MRALVIAYSGELSACGRRTYSTRTFWTTSVLAGRWLLGRMAGMPDYYSREGKPITALERDRLASVTTYWRVAEDTVRLDAGEVWVSTIWRGNRQAVYETLVVPEDRNQQAWLWVTEVDAKRGHDAVVAWVRAGMPDLPLELDDGSGVERRSGPS
jgi:hypothetical protein